ncbi:MAG: peptidylprolyl isomerase [Haloferacaceae archaeon]
MAITTGDSVTIEYTGRDEDGTVFDTSRESVAEETGLTDRHPERDYGPLTVEIGAEEVIEGLEEALIGMEQGETRTVTIPPEKGYGERVEEKVKEYDAEEFDQIVGSQTPEEGQFIETQSGGFAQIVHIGDDVVRVDFNHPLAGETLEFEMEVVEVGGTA